MADAFYSNKITKFFSIFLLFIVTCLPIYGSDSNLVKREIDDVAGEDVLVESLTPRTKAGMRAVECFDRLKKSHPDFIERRKDEGGTRECAFQQAYENTEIEVLIISAWKSLTSGEISDYERKVVAECSTKLAIVKIVDKIVCKGIPVVAMGLKAFRNAVQHEVIPMVVKKVGIEPWKSKHWAQFY